MLGLLNGIDHPRNVSAEGAQDSIIIMWTNICGWPDRLKGLKVNHFVPVLPLNTQNTDTFVWNVVAKKRKGKCNERPSRRPNVSTDRGRNKNDDKLKVKSEKRIKQAKIKKYTSATQNDEKASLLKSLVQAGAQEVIHPGKQKLEDTELHMSMPLLSMNWYEKTGENSNNILYNDKSILSMPLISQHFYSRTTGCAKPNTAEPGHTAETLQANIDNSNKQVDCIHGSHPSEISNEKSNQIFHHPEEPD